MSNFEKLEKFIKDHVGLIVVDAKGMAEAQDRAGKFLVAAAVLTSAQKDLEIAMAKTKTLQEATFGQALGQSSGTITEKKEMSKLDPEYVIARESHEESEARRTWLKGFVRIFTDAHVLFRRVASE